MTSYNFQGTLFNTRDEYISAIAYEGMTSCGQSSTEQVTDILKQGSDSFHADDILSGWAIDDVTADELTEAIADFRRDRPDID